jgi:hypothetical protein
MKPDSRLNLPSIEASEEVLRDGYGKLGELSTSFAELEEEFHELISKLISEDWVISSYLIDRNTLEKNIQLLSKINEYLEFEQVKVEGIIKSINAIKEKRNELIHGVWAIRIVKNDNTPLVIVSSHRMARYDTIFKSKKSWASRTLKSYTFEEISVTINSIKGIIGNLRELSELKSRS